MFPCPCGQCHLNPSPGESVCPACGTKLIRHYDTEYGGCTRYDRVDSRLVLAHSQYRREPHNSDIVRDLQRLDR